MKIKKENQNDEEIIQSSFNILDHVFFPFSFVWIFLKFVWVIFFLFLKDGKGFVIEKDFTKVMKDRSPSITDEKCHELFCNADVDRSGKVTYGISIRYSLFSVLSRIYLTFKSNIKIFRKITQFILKSLKIWESEDWIKKEKKKRGKKPLAKFTYLNLVNLW